MAKQGKEETELFLGTLASFPMKDVSKVMPSFHSSSWLLGLAAQVPKVEILPSAAGQIRLQVLGTVVFIAVDSAAFAKVAKSVDKIENLNAAAATEKLRNMTTDQLEKYSTGGCTFFQHIQLAGEVLWLPCGLVVAYRANQSPLVYGIRKSIFPDGAHVKDSLAGVAAMIKAENRSNTRLDDLRALYD